MNKLLVLLFCSLLISSTFSSAFFQENKVSEVTDDFEGKKGVNHEEDHGEDSGEHYQSSEWNIVNYSDEGETQDQGYYEATIWQDDNGEYHIYGEYHRVIYTTNGSTYEELGDYGEYSQTSYPTHSHSNSKELPKDLGLPKFIKRQRKQQE